MTFEDFPTSPILDDPANYDIVRELIDDHGWRVSAVAAKYDWPEIIVRSLYAHAYYEIGFDEGWKERARKVKELQRPALMG